MQWWRQTLISNHINECKITTVTSAKTSTVNGTDMELKSICILHIEYILYFCIFEGDELSILKVSMKKKKVFICVRYCLRVRKSGLDLLTCH